MMTSQFNTLFSLSVSHEFYAGLCPDFRFYWQEDSVRRLKRGRMVSKIINGAVYCLYRADHDNSPLIDLSGEKLLVALTLNNPYFSNFTDYEQSDQLSFYSNDDEPHSLAFKHSLNLVGSVLTHRISQINRPVTIALNNSIGEVIDTQTVQDSRQSECHFNLQANDHRKNCHPA